MRELALADIRVGEQRGLEIGPLARPIVSKDRGEVYYVDHAGRDELRAKYAADANMQSLLDSIVEVDYVLRGDEPLSAMVAAEAPFDYVIASHLIEHIPDLVGWLADIASILKPGGVLSLIVPDKRYTFDVNRRTTDISSVVDAYMRRLTRPTVAQTYDFFARALNGVVDPAEAWKGTVDYSALVRQDYDDVDVAALEHCRIVAASDDFIDVHCHVFTPESFLELSEKLMRLDLLPFSVSRFFPTRVDDIEFFVSLRAVDGRTGGGGGKADQLRSVAEARRSLAPGPPGSAMAVSRLERRAILAKRAALHRIRAAVASARRG